MPTAYSFTDPQINKGESFEIDSHVIPSGDNVILPGYDGTGETSEGTEYILEGMSDWQIGSNKNFKVKAEGDLLKRSKDIDTAVAAETTFVFVTPRMWTGREAYKQLIFQKSNELITDHDCNNVSVHLINRIKKNF